nr:glycogen debranching N-terminal domain-containing protein [Vallicoccus soli]
MPDLDARPPAAGTAVERPLQPLLHDLVAALRAPTQVWSAADGQVRASGAQGAYHGDLRVLSRAVLLLDGEEAEHVATVPYAADDVLFVALARRLGDPGPDPTVRVERRRRVRPGRVEEEVLLRSTAAREVVTEVALAVACDLSPMEVVKQGGRREELRSPGPGLAWERDGARVALEAPGAQVDGAAGTATWAVRLPARGEALLRWAVTAEDPGAVVTAPASPAPEWSVPRVRADDSRLAPLLARSLDDLAGLRMAPVDAPHEAFLAAGAPWFFTLFGRDSLWAARMLLPLGTGLAASTLRVLAARQGRRVDGATAEEPGKVLHEVRAGTFEVVGDHEGAVLSLPPVYYGTVDATPLWVCLLHDAWRWGMPAAQVEALLPAAEAALEWMVEHGGGGDGFLHYVDRTGSGLSNQGWKDSGDSVRWRDGSLARAPIALCEVQGYAYEAAVGGAALLAAHGRAGADRWRAWADDLAARFRARFWVEDEEGPYPAIALDADGRPVDTLTSNVGHLLGTGLLDERESAVLAQRLVSPRMLSGYGVRTLASGSGGFAPLSYHGGSVWPHDTAIVLTGLARAGRSAEAALVVDALLAAGEAFDHRLPELFGGDARADVPRPVPYPAACRPQAWSAAAGVAVLGAVLGLRPDAPAGTLGVEPLAPSPVGALEVEGLRFGGEPVAVRLDRDGRRLA